MNKRKFLSYFPALAGLMGGGVVAGKAVASDKVKDMTWTMSEVHEMMEGLNKELGDQTELAQHNQDVINVLEMDKEALKFRIESLEHKLNVTNEYAIKLEDKLRIGYSQG